MSANRFTPGPWFCDSADVEGAERAAVRADDGALLAVAWPGERDGVGVIGDVEQDANAALIAAAPELLDACRLALDVLAGIFPDPAHADTNGMPVLRAAIARAEGR